MRPLFIPWEFKGDNRGPGENFGDSRILTSFTIDTAKLGQYKDFSPKSVAGLSVRRLFGFLDGTPGYLTQEGKTKVTQDSSFRNVVGYYPSGRGRRDTCSTKETTQFVVSASGNYPFIKLSPDIDYNLTIAFSRTPSGIFITFGFVHNLFPDYEVIVDGVVFSYPTLGKGPGLINLSARKAEEENFTRPE